MALVSNVVSLPPKARHLFQDIAIQFGDAYRSRNVTSNDILQKIFVFYTFRETLRRVILIHPQVLTGGLISLFFLSGR
jgi:hypothetical protein